MMIALLALATGCSDAPRLDPTISARARDAAYPELVPPLGPLLAGGLPTDDGDLGTGTLTARAAALRARAARLRGTVVDAPPARDRMRAAVARHAR